MYASKWNKAVLYRACATTISISEYLKTLVDDTAFIYQVEYAGLSWKIVNPFISARKSISLDIFTKKCCKKKKILNSFDSGRP